MAIRNQEYVRSFGVQPDRRLNERNVLSALTEIWREHSVRCDSAFGKMLQFGLSKNENAKNFLRREVYALGLELKRMPQRWNLAEFIASIRVHKTTRLDALNGRVFPALLLGVYEEDSSITRQERWVMSKELEYAEAHNVPPEFLCGFLYQSGGRQDLLKKLAAGFVEPAFRKKAEDTGSGFAIQTAKAAPTSSLPVVAGWLPND